MKKKYCNQFNIGLLLVFIAMGPAKTQTTSTAEDYSQSESIQPMPVDSGNGVVTETVFGEDGSIQFSTETIKLLKDATYRAGKYPAEYLLTQVPDLLENGDLPFALWTLINTYKSKPEQARAIAFKLADHGIQGSDYLDAFYTYVFTDPEIFAFQEGQEPFLQNPLPLEEKLESCQSLAVYANQYLKMKGDGK